MRGPTARKTGIAVLTALVVVALGVGSAGAADATIAAPAITGTITVPAGESPIGIEVSAYDLQGNFVAGAWPDDAGNYLIQSLSPGTYDVLFDARTSPTHVRAPFETQWWHGSPERSGATPVTLAASDSVVTGIDATMAFAGGGISGSFTGVRSLTPGDGAASTACAVRTPEQEVERCGPVAADGSYSLTSLRPGGYKLAFLLDTGSAMSWLENGETQLAAGRTLWWHNAADWATADPLNVSDGATLTASEDASTTAGQPTYPNITTTVVRAGRPVTASPGYWPAGSVLTYVWYADGTQVADTGTTPSFTPSISEVGKRLMVRVIGPIQVPLGQYREGMASLPTAPVLGMGMVTSLPTISGIPAVTQTLTVHRGTWTPGTSFTYAWYANGAYIPGSVGHSTFRPTTAQVGKRITVKVTGSQVGYETTPRVSNPTLKIALTAAPTISGTFRVGYNLYAHHGTWTKGTAFSYAWYANGVYIRGSAGPTHWSLKLTSALRGKYVAVRVTGSLSGYATIGRGSYYEYLIK